MTTSDETDWEFFTLWESIRKFVNCIQSNTETPNEFRKRFEEKSRHNLETRSWIILSKQPKATILSLEVRRWHRIGRTITLQNEGLGNVVSKRNALQQ